MIVKTLTLDVDGLPDRTVRALQDAVVHLRQELTQKSHALRRKLKPRKGSIIEPLDRASLYEHRLGRIRTPRDAGR